MKSTRTYTMDSRAAGVTATRERIVRAAQALFLEQAFEDVTLAAIAKASGVSHQTVLNHFESKEGVVLAVAELLKAERTAARYDADARRRAGRGARPGGATTSRWATPTSAGRPPSASRSSPT